MIMLRPFTREEYHDFYRRYRPDPIMDPRPYRYSREHVDRCYDYDLSRADWSPTFGIFNEESVAVGTLSLKRIDRAKNCCEIGIVMANDRCKNRGYGTEAMRQAIVMAREAYGLRTILADTMGSNLRMQHILEKLGFRLTERIPHVYDMQDRWEDRLNYALTLSAAPKRILLGTNNPSKLAMLRQLAEADGVECVSPAELGLQVNPPENARDAAGNALEKAIAFHRACGLPVLAQDSGLVFTQLPMDHPDQPGVHVRRPKDHPPLTDDEEMLRYYQDVAHRHGGRLLAAWQDAWCFLQDEEHYALYTDDPNTLTSHAEWMLDTPCTARQPGWPLNSLFFSEETGKYWAENTAEEKRDDPDADDWTPLHRIWVQEQIAKL